MDYGLIDGLPPGGGSSGAPHYEAFEPARHAMGDTRRFAERVDLLRMHPRGDLSSTGFALADAGAEYLVLQPASDRPFDLDLAAGRYAVERFAVESRTSHTGGDVVGAGGRHTFSAPFGGAAVLYLRSIVLYLRSTESTVWTGG